MPAIYTPRLVLIPATVDTLRAELEGSSALARALGVEVPEDWPPELYDENATRWMLGELERTPAFAHWGMSYIAERVPEEESANRVIGAGGLKGPPGPDGFVEIGYSILPAFRRQGFAREAVDGWLAWAFAHDRVERVIAHTLVDLAPSIAVLQSAGFTSAGSAGDPDEPTAVRFEITRAEYDASRMARSPARFGAA